ncbi:hypothetical protein WDU94_007594, partial [Cyamophila willieti]
MSAKWVKVAETCLVAVVSAAVPILMIYTIDDCRPLGEDPTENPVQMFCGDGEYNTLAGLWLQVPEKSVRTLFHDPKAALNSFSLGCFVVAYFLLAVWTYGISVSGGVFIPCLLTGAAWGRLFSQFLGHLFPGQDWVEPGKYALIGAAAQLGGVVRMTISLTVILIEATGNISFGLPLMLTLITAKWIGDFFTEGLYDIHIQLAGIPLLAWDPPPLSSNITARIVKSHPVICLRPVETVGNIMDVLKATSHNGFPIVEVVGEEQVGGEEGVEWGKGKLSRQNSRRSWKTPRSVSATTTPTTPTGHFSPTRTFPARPAPSRHPSSPSSDEDTTDTPTRKKHSSPDTESRVDCQESPGRLVGLILRSQLIILIKNQIYKENQNWSDDMITADIFHNEYPRYPDVTDLTVSAEDRNFTVKLNMFMNVSPFSVQ